MLLIIFLSNITQSKKQNEIKGLIVFLLKIKKWEIERQDNLHWK